MISPNYVANAARDTLPDMKEESDCNGGKWKRGVLHCNDCERGYITTL